MNDNRSSLGSKFCNAKGSGATQERIESRDFFKVERAARGSLRQHGGSTKGLGSIGCQDIDCKSLPN